MSPARAPRCWSARPEFCWSRSGWRASARTLLERQQSDGLWTQNLYASRLRYLGAGHGFAGNIHALGSAADWLEDPDGVGMRAVETLRATAIIDSDVARWPALDIGSRNGAPPRVQWCHGAPGIDDL